jgi:hypothetical protein
MARLKRPSDQFWFRVWMPYQFVRVRRSSPRHIYLPVNRNYVPLGVGTPVGQQDWVDYEAASSHWVEFAEDPHTFQAVWNEPEHLYLCGDDPQSQATYFARLALLMQHQMKPVSLSSLET